MSKFTKAKYNKLVAEAAVGLRELAQDIGGEIEDAMFSEISGIELDNDAGIAEYLESTGVRDVQGRFADDIYGAM